MKISVLFSSVIVGTMLQSGPSWARECGGRPSHGYYPTSGSQSSELTEKPIDARPWLELSEDEANRALDGELSCTVSRVDGSGDIAASIEVAPANGELIRGGCTTVGVFSTAFARVTPDVQLEANTAYRIVCDEELDFGGSDEFITGDGLASPPPDVMIENIGVGGYCGAKRIMTLDIRGLDSEFWGEGGVLTAEYEDGSVDWVGEVFSDPATVVLELPAEGDEVLVFTVVNGAGVAGPPLELDVSEIAGPRPINGCTTGGFSDSLFVSWLCLLLLLRGRSRPVVSA